MWRGCAASIAALAMSPQPEDTSGMKLHEVDGSVTCHGQPLLEDIAADEDEDSMQGLIRHMICMILQPFAEHVRQLQTQMLHAQKDMHLLDDRVNHNKAHLDAHDRDILGMRSTDGALSARMDKMALEIAKEHEEAVKLEHDLEATKVALTKTNDRAQNLKMYVDAMQQRFDELDDGVAGMKGNVTKMDKTLKGHLKQFSQLKEAHDELIGRHSDGAGALDMHKEQYESLEREFQRFLKNHKKQTEEDTQILGSLNAHVTSLHAVVEDTRDSLQKTSSDLRSTNGDVQMVRDTLEHVTGQLKVVDEMQRAQQDMNHNLRKTMEMLSKTDDAVEKLGDSFVLDRKSANAVMQDLRAKAETHAESISGLSKMQSRQGDLLKDTVWRTDKLQRESKRLQEQADNDEMELQNLSASLKNANIKLEAHAQEHLKTQQDMQGLTKELDNSMNQMKGDLGTTGSTLAKLNARFEATTGNIQGIGKGLQDVHRHIQAGENGMLSPKTARQVNQNMLPALSARGSKPSTRGGPAPPSQSWAAEAFAARPNTRGGYE